MTAAGWGSTGDGGANHAALPDEGKGMKGSVRERLTIVALCLTASVMVGDVIITPSINDIYLMFPDDTLLVNFIVSGIYLVVFLASAPITKFLERFGCRFAIGIACILTAVGGVLLAYSPNAWVMCILRVVQAFGLAATQISGMSFIARRYPSEDRRSYISSRYYATEFFIGIIVGIVAGNLAAISFGLACMLYWIYLPIAVVAIVLLPSKENEVLSVQSPELALADAQDMPAGCDDASAEGAKDHAGKIGSMEFIVFAACFIAMYYVVMTRFCFTSTYLAENGLGSQVDAGYLESMYTLFSCVGALTGNWIRRMLREWVLPLAYGFYFATFILLNVFCTLPMTYVSYAVCGIGCGWMTAHVYAIVPNIVGLDNSTKAASILVGGSAVSQFLAPYIATGAVELLGFAQISDTFVIPLIVSGIVVVASGVQAFSNSRRAA